MQPSDEQSSGNWTFRNEDSAGASGPNDQPDSSPAKHTEPVTWTASEFIAHHKSGGWYSTVVFGAIALCILIYLITGDLFSTIAVAVVAILFLVISNHKPSQQAYTVSDTGVTIGEKHYSYSSFKSYALIYEGPIGSITFAPLKRLMPEISIYFAPEDEPKILEVLSANLPNDQRREEGFDRFIRKIRF